MEVKLEESESSLISSILYERDTMELEIKFKKYYTDSIIYTNVPYDIFVEFATTKSFGKFYLSRIKPLFLTKQNPQKMADKVIKIKIDVNAINKDWLFVGETTGKHGKPRVYLNCTLLYNEEPNANGQNGMVVQDVPTEIYKKDKTIKGEILGNGKEFPKEKTVAEEMQPGKETGKMGSDDISDDLPF